MLVFPKESGYFLLYQNILKKTEWTELNKSQSKLLTMIKGISVKFEKDSLFCSYRLVRVNIVIEFRWGGGVI